MARDRVPSDEFFPRPRHDTSTFREFRKDVGVAGSGGPRGRGEPGAAAPIPQERFYRAARPPTDRPFVRWVASPRAHAAVLVIAGFSGVFLEQANIFLQIVVGAPVFEELFKFGLGLGLVTLAGLRPRVARFVVALVPGAAFGAFEHWFSYAEEPASVLYFRMVFHAVTPALSMAVYDAVASWADVTVRWTATVPASIMHWLNNFFALWFGFASVIAGEAVIGPAFQWSVAVTAATAILAVAALMFPGPARAAVAGTWDRFAPASVKAGAPKEAGPAAPGDPWEMPLW